MDFELPYPEAGCELELDINQIYLKGLKKIKEYLDEESSDLVNVRRNENVLETLKSIYESLGNSHPPFQKNASIWGADMIKVYRNLAVITSELIGNIGSLEGRVVDTVDEDSLFRREF